MAENSPIDWRIILPVTPTPVPRIFQPRLTPIERSEAPNVPSGRTVSLVRLSMPPSPRWVTLKPQGRRRKPIWDILIDSTCIEWLTSNSFSIFAWREAPIGSRAIPPGL